MKKWAYVSLVIALLAVGVWSRGQSGALPEVFGVKTDSPPFPDGMIIGSWIWKSPDEISPSDMDNLLTFASSQRINTLYLEVDRYLSITLKNDSIARQVDLERFNASLSLFLKKAHQQGISVHALGGEESWSDPSSVHLPYRLLDYVLAWNRSHPDEQFSGIQFDVEFYNRPGFSQNRTVWISDYLTFVTGLINRIKADEIAVKSGFQLGLAIPFWLDNPNGGRSFSSLVQILNSYPGSYVAIMSYRNYVGGRDGTFNLVKNEMEYVGKYTPGVSVIVGQETGVGDLPKTTFFGRSKQDLKQAIGTLAIQLKSYPAFKGFAIHHFKSFQDLPDQ